MQNVSLAKAQIYQIVSFESFIKYHNLDNYL